VPSAADRVPQCPEDHEDQADQEHNDPDRPDDWDGRDKANSEKDDAENDHGGINLRGERSGQADLVKPTLSKAVPT
jgi:hypothetical protein